MILHGDCVAVMATMAPASVDAIVTDPPYGLEFMGKEWDRLGATVAPFEEALTEGGRIDYHGKGNAPFGGGGQRVRYGASAGSMQAWHEAWAIEALRVLKPGGHLLAFGGTRTSHRLVCAIEDAGFEIRDTIAWLYGSGFPKSLNVGKAIDKAAGAARRVIATGSPLKRMIPGSDQNATGSWVKDNGREFVPTETEPATPEAERWEGWGTALKPAHEPIVVARKPLTGTVAANVLAHGTGGLNVDGCRIAGDRRPVMVRTETAVRGNSMSGETRGGTSNGEMTGLGRWPANVVLDPEAGALLDEQTGTLTSGRLLTHHKRGGKAPIGTFEIRDRTGEPCDFGGDTGGASRFFYCAKAGRAERNAGLDAFKPAFAPTMGNGIGGKEHETATPKRNTHPTVKPVALMRWLVRLTTPPGGTVLDPFTGSGTTGIAAALEGFEFVGIEREAEYVTIAEARIAAAHADKIMTASEATAASGQTSMFDDADDRAP